MAAGKHAHYNDVTMDEIASQTTSVYSTVCSGTDERKHQSSASLAFAHGIHRPLSSAFYILFWQTLNSCDVMELRHIAGVGILSQRVDVLPQSVSVLPLFCVRFIKSFYFYNMIHFTTKISVYQEFDVCSAANWWRVVPPGAHSGNKLSACSIDLNPCPRYCI